jgi:hypothetical protein
MIRGPIQVRLGVLVAIKCNQTEVISFTFEQKKRSKCELKFCSSILINFMRVFRILKSMLT